MDRENRRLTLYLDGVEASGVDFPDSFDASLANPADILVGGGPEKESLAATVNYLRVAAASLAEPKTSID